MLTSAVRPEAQIFRNHVPAPHPHSAEHEYSSPLTCPLPLTFILTLNLPEFYTTCLTYYVDQANSCKELELKQFRLCKPYIFVTVTQLCHFISAAALGKKEMSEHGCVSVQLCLRTLKFEFHVVFTGHEVLRFFDLVSTI